MKPPPNKALQSTFLPPLRYGKKAAELGVRTYKRFVHGIYL